MTLAAHLEALILQKAAPAAGRRQNLRPSATSPSDRASREYAPFQAMPAASQPKLSVVIATWNRRPLIERLLGQLAAQTLPPTDFEVVVVDDGSTEPVKPALDALAETLPYHLKVLRQANAGAAAARDRGVRAARAPLLVITDDDMQVDPDYLELHLHAHDGAEPLVAMGRIRPDPALSSMPLFERWIADINRRAGDDATAGRTHLLGNSLLTGNVSLPRADYLAVGGFDKTLRRSEDSELGLRLEKRGLKFVFLDKAHVFHGSDLPDIRVLLSRAHNYGLYDSRIARKHPDVPHASPWRYLLKIHPLARPLVAAAWLAPRLSMAVSRLGIAAVEAADRLGRRPARLAGVSGKLAERLAFKATAVVYTMEYYRGVREEASLLAGLGDFVDYLRHRREAT